MVFAHASGEKITAVISPMVTVKPMLWRTGVVQKARRPKEKKVDRAETPTDITVDGENAFSSAKKMAKSMPRPNTKRRENK